MMCEGRTAIVTGAAGRGMGRSIALTLAREGASVVVNYLTSSASAASVVGQIKKQGGRALAGQGDITKQEQCAALVEATVKAFGQPDICVIGPGGGWHQEPVDKLDSAAALDDAGRAGRWPEWLSRDAAWPSGSRCGPPLMLVFSATCDKPI